jgi:serine/threonine protein kinase
MAYSMVPGYRYLYEVPKILHRDISLNNLMLRKEGGKVYAVLNDFDRAVNADVQGQSSNQRTGTKPFMAIDLLTPLPPVYMYRHDLESLFYVLVWITSRFHDGVEIEEPPLGHWEDRDEIVRAFKLSFLMQVESYKPTNQFKSFRDLIECMCGMFEEGHGARRRARKDPAFARNFTMDTLGGFVTFETFQSVLDANLP